MVRLLCVVLLMGSMSAAGVRAGAGQLDAALVKRLDALVEAERQKLGAPALSVAIARNGEVVYANAIGMADLEQQVPATPRTRFRTASVAKPITATAVMQLVDAGRLSLDAPIQQYCRAYPQKESPVTVGRLLAHLGGVRHYKDGSGESTTTTHFFTLADAVKVFAADALVAEPGTKYSYTTYGYTLLGCAMEAVTGGSYAEYMQRHVFGPAGMADTTADEHFAIIANRARGYLKLDADTLRQLPDAVKRWARVGEIYNTQLHDTSVKQPGGGLLSTPSDLVRFAAALQAGKLLAPALRDRMWTTQQTSDGTPIDYGYGWGVRRDSRGLTLLTHSGNQSGASSSFIVVPERSLAGALMTNLEDVNLGPLTGAIGELLLGPAKSAALPAEAGSDANTITWTPAALKIDGRGSEAAEHGTLTVPENRAVPGGRTIDLALLRLKSRAAKPGPPIVYLEGGPGGSALGIATIPDYFAAFDRLRDVADVILFDQRGAGRSGRLACPPVRPVPGTVFLDVAHMRAALQPNLEACLAQMKAKGVDLAHYNTNTIADDVDAIRQALGVERISILGHSYGTHLGLACIRRHEARLHKAVLIAVEGPDHTVKLPSWMDVHITNVARVAAADPAVRAVVPDLMAELKAVLDRFEKAPVTYELKHPRTGEVANVQVGRTGLQYIIRRDIGDTNDLPRFPALIHALYKGKTDVLKPLVERRYGAFAAGVSVMPFAVDCASGASRTRLEQVALEEPRAILGPDVLGDAACELVRVPDLGDAFRSRLTSAVPTLFISGTLDAHTPPFQAEEVRWGFPFSTHLIVERAGHESLLDNHEVGAAIADFLAGKDVSGRRIVHPLKFEPPQR